jgi:hypothetical protein
MRWSNAGTPPTGLVLGHPGPTPTVRFRPGRGAPGRRVEPLPGRPGPNPSDFSTTHFGFEPMTVAAPDFADVARDRLRLLLSGPKSSAGRAMTDGTVPRPGRLEPHPPRAHATPESGRTATDRGRRNGSTGRWARGDLNPHILSDTGT